MKGFSRNKTKILHWIKQWEAAEARTEEHRLVLFKEFYHTVMFSTDDITPALLTAPSSKSSSVCKAFEEWLCRTHPSIRMTVQMPESAENSKSADARSLKKMTKVTAEKEDTAPVKRKGGEVRTDTTPKKSKGVSPAFGPCRRAVRTIISSDEGSVSESEDKPVYGVHKERAPDKKDHGTGNLTKPQAAPVKKDSGTSCGDLPIETKPQAAPVKKDSGTCCDDLPVRTQAAPVKPKMTTQDRGTSSDDLQEFIERGITLMSVSKKRGLEEEESAIEPGKRARLETPSEEPPLWGRVLWKLTEYLP